MGARGPQPTPTRLRIVTGNPSKRPLPKGEPKPAAGLSKPAHVNGPAAEEWDRAVKAMPPGFFTEADAPVLAVYCIAWVFYRQALSILAKKPANGGGMLAKGSTGQDVAHPMLGELRKQAELMLKASDRLGMSPAARARLNSGNEDDDEEPEDRFFSRSA